MALVVFLRGINVGGHRRLRPSVLARELAAYDVVNVGAAGTFVVRKPVSRSRLLAELLRKLPFRVEVALCDGRELVRSQVEAPFGDQPPPAGTVRFVSVLSRPGHCRSDLPVTLPPAGEWLVRIIGSKGRFVFGEYRRHMKTIACLGQIDGLFGAPAITRNWDTMVAVARILTERAVSARSAPRRSSARTAPGSPPAPRR